MKHVYLRRPTDKPEIEKYIDRFQSQHFAKKYYNQLKISKISV